jgi:hypothetical protein
MPRFRQHQADLWTKMIMDCAYNAISALGRRSTAHDRAEP